MKVTFAGQAGLPASEQPSRVARFVNGLQALVKRALSVPPRPRIDELAGGSSVKDPLDEWELVEDPNPEMTAQHAKVLREFMQELPSSEKQHRDELLDANSAEFAKIAAQFKPPTQ